MPKGVPPDLCVRCKGYKRLCGLAECPILRRFRAQLRALSSVGFPRREVRGSTPPSVVVGETPYPKVPVLLNIPPGVSGEEARKYDDPEGWWGRLSLGEIVELRSSLLASVIRADARDPWGLYSSEVSVAAVSLRPVDAEAELAKPPIARLSFDGILSPLGPRAPARRVRVVGNAKPHPRLEKLVWDDATAKEAVLEAYRHGVSIYDIVRAMSLGLLGRYGNRRLVPTRWAITAVDSIVSGRFHNELRGCEELSGVEVYYERYLGNVFIVALIPGSYEAEWLEVWHPRSAWAQRLNGVAVASVYEDYMGRQSAMDGGYMAARLPVLEHLASRRRQAKVLIIREVLPTYYAPVGNWHIRETVRRALAKPPVRGSDPLETLKLVCSRLLTAPCEEVLSRSKLLRKLSGQRLLTDYSLAGER